MNTFETEVEQRCRGGKTATIADFQELQKMGEVLEKKRPCRIPGIIASIYRTVLKWANKVDISPKQILEN